jgi:hypothetical protein
MRLSYERCVRFLWAATTGDEKEEMRALVRAEVLKSAGYTTEEAEKFAADPKTNIAELVSKKLGGVAAGPSRAEFRGDEAKARLIEGWTVVGKFDDGSYVLQRPNA